MDPAWQRGRIKQMHASRVRARERENQRFVTRTSQSVPTQSKVLEQA